MNEWARAVGVCTVTGRAEYIVYCYFPKASTNAQIKDPVCVWGGANIPRGLEAYWLKLSSVGCIGVTAVIEMWADYVPTYEYSLKPLQLEVLICPEDCEARSEMERMGKEKGKERKGRVFI